MSDFMGECDMRNGWRHVFAIVQQSHDAGVQGLEGASVMLMCSAQRNTNTRGGERVDVTIN